MSRKKAVNISVTKPCQENWEAMQQEGAGRFCNNCKKVVVDFSHLSDRELYNYFSTTEIIPCGRFHNDQLNKNILALRNRKNIWGNFYKVAATVFAFSSLKYSNATNNSKKIETSISPFSFSQKIDFIPEKIIISGTVKDEHGHTIENVQVKFGDSLIVTTDKEGKFSIEIDSEKEIKPTLLSFSLTDWVSTIRSYHPSMLSTTYSVILYPMSPETGGFTMGVPAVVKLKPLPATIDCNRTHFLTNKVKALIAAIAGSLRNNPEVSINIIAYAAKNNAKSKSMYTQSALKTHLIEKEGIAGERLKLVTRKGNPAKQGTLEIEQCEEQ